MALTKVSGQVVKTNTDLTVGVLTATTATFTTVSVAGTITYDDVTNVDSVGLITARSGVNITSGGLIVTGISTVSAGTTSAPSISPSGDTNTGIFFPSADTIAFGEGGVESARFDSSGRLLVGTSSARANLFNASASAQLQIEGTDGNNSAVLIARNSNDTAPPNFHLAKSRGTTVGSNTVVQNNDLIGRITFTGSDGTEFVDAAFIEASVDGTPGANDMPGRLIFSTTADGASTPTERARITSAGLFGIGVSSPQQSIDTNGNIRLSSGGSRVLDVLQNVNAAAYTGPGFYSASSLGYGVSSGGTHRWIGGDGNTELMRLTSTGLGIGSSSPATQFSVQNASTSFGVETDTTSGFASGPTIRGYYRAGSAYTSLGLTGSAVAFGINDVEKMRLTGTGLGIGTTSPSNVLHIAATTPTIRLQDTDGGRAMVSGADGNLTFEADPDSAVASSHIKFNVDDTERARIDSSGRLLVGTSSNRGNWFNNSSWGGPLIQLESTSSTESAYSVTNSANNANAPLILLGKNRSGTIGGNTVVQSGDSCGQISFFGNDGTQMVEAARIDVAVDSTPGADDMPGRLVFSTCSDGSATPQERLRLDSTGRMVMGGAVFFSTGGSATLNTTFSFDVTVKDDSGSGIGGTYKVFAGINHFNFGSYGAVYEAWIATRGTSVNETISQVSATSGQGGSWSVSKPANTTLRVTHNAGSLGALGNYFVIVLAAA